METNIMILSAMDYEKEGKQHGVLNFIFADPQYFQKTDKYLGYNNCTQFYNNFIRNVLPDEVIGKPVKAKLVSQSSLKDPLKVYNVIESITANGKVINLLQSK